MSKSTTKTKRAATESDPLKDAANAIVDAMVASNGERTLQFAARLAAEQARGHALGAFSRRSMNNRLYLEAQVRARGEDAKHLFAGTAQWAKMDRKVVDGEKAYKIYGCNFYDKKEKDAAGQETTTRVYRRSSPILEVFDWTQTVSTNPDYIEPDWETPLAAGDNATLLALADSLDIPVTFTDLSAKNYHGTYDGESIVIDDEAGIGNQIVELARQAAHHVLGHPTAVAKAPRRKFSATAPAPYTERYVAEQEAALTAWLVARGLGLDESVGNDVTAQCAEYLARWSKFDKDGEVIDLEGIKSRRKLVLERLNGALTAADTILAAYCQQNVTAETDARELVPA
jgi:hypothetical protein